MDINLVYLQIFFIFWRYQKRNAFSIMLCVTAFMVLPTAIVADRTAFATVQVRKGKHQIFLISVGGPSLNVGWF